MHGLLSILIALSMLCTGAYHTEQPEAPAARSITISDIQFTMGEEHLGINPSVNLGVMTQDSEALLDFSMTLDDARLMPLQMRLTPEDITLLFPQSQRGYTFDQEAMENILDWDVGGEELLPSDLQEGILEAIQILGTMPNFLSPEIMWSFYQAQDQAFVQEADRGTPVESRITADGEILPVQIYSYKLDTAQYSHIMDTLSQTIPEYGQYLESLARLSGDASLESYADYWQQMGMAYEALVTETVSEDDAYQERHMKILVYQSGMLIENLENTQRYQDGEYIIESVSKPTSELSSLPVRTVTVLQEDAMTLDITIFPSDTAKMSEISHRIAPTAYYYEPFQLVYHLEIQPDAPKIKFNMLASDGTATEQLEFVMTDDDSGHLKVDTETGDIFNGFECDFRISSALFEDFASTAKMIHVSDENDTISLGLSALGLYIDAQKLLLDDSMQNLMEWLELPENSISSVVPGMDGLPF